MVRRQRPPQWHLLFTAVGLIAAVWWLVLLRLLTGLGEAAFFVGAATAAQDGAARTGC